MNFTTAISSWTLGTRLVVERGGEGCLVPQVTLFGDGDIEVGANCLAGDLLRDDWVVAARAAETKPWRDEDAPHEQV